MIKIKKGDLIHEALQGKYGIISHGVNCFCNMGAGIAPQMARHFGCDNFPLEQTGYGDPNKLGQIDYKAMYLHPNHLGTSSVIPHKAGEKDHRLIVVNSYTQYRYGRNHEDGDEKPLDYDALRMVFKKLNMTFKQEGVSLGLPAIGCGLAKGDLFSVLLIASELLKDLETTFVIRDQNLWDKYYGGFEALQRDGKLIIE